MPDAAIGELHPRRHPQPQAVRALEKQRSARAAELALSVLERPMDPFLEGALWLTINALAEPWVAAVQEGAWDFKGREKQLEFALKAIEPSQAGSVLEWLLRGQKLPEDGSGPWIDLIGAAGKPAELRQIFEQLLDGGFNYAGALRALAALREAARLRGALPEGDLTAVERMFDAKDTRVRTAAVQLAGAWRLDHSSGRLLECARRTDMPATERTAVFAALREIGGPQIAGDLKSLVATSSSMEIRREAAVTLASIAMSRGMPGFVGRRPIVHDRRPVTTAIRRTNRESTRQR